MFCILIVMFLYSYFYIYVFLLLCFCILIIMFMYSIVTFFILIFIFMYSYCYVLYSYCYVFVFLLLCLCIFIIMFLFLLLCFLFLLLCMFPSRYSVSLFLLRVLFVCKCVLYYCHWMSTQLQLANITISISINNSVWQGHPWEVPQDLPSIEWAMAVPFSINNFPAVTFILCKINPFHTLSSRVLRSILTIQQFTKDSTIIIFLNFNQFNH